ncbi:MAG: cation:proton antiporter [Candidatus Eisenbacteria bacterium]|uniref:Cation:proton antiporter n=1 Tax=Eiseniibacteriota bacterium TaxID=2212470 RepID=A0A538T2A1_UNCEI|nr:MAG: cation:proton antiporter [Candidatus Eisenbacteria bacterium]
MQTLATAALLALLVFLASVVAVEAAISVAIIEIAAGVFAGNALGIRGAPWLDFLAQFGGILLTFLAGAEVDPGLLRSKLRPSLALGGASFLLPFLASAAFAAFVAHWTPRASLIAGAALSTTSLAVVYVVLVETRLNATELGKLIMAATFVTDIGTALALSLLFAAPGWATAGFFAVSALVVLAAPRLLPPVFERYGARVIEPEIKLLFALLLGLMLLAQWGKSHAVLPAFVLGLALAPMFHRHRELQRKLRVVAFGMVTPFFFLKGGMNLSLGDLGPHVVLLLGFFLVKIAAKSVGVFPLARLHMPGAATYTTLLMSTGLTFGTISALYGLQAGHIDRAQFSVLLTTVIGTAIVPTLIAQGWFAPRLTPEEQEEALARAEESA